MNKLTEIMTGIGRESRTLGTARPTTRTRSVGSRRLSPPQTRIWTHAGAPRTALRASAHTKTETRVCPHPDTRTGKQANVQVNTHIARMIARSLERTHARRNERNERNEELERTYL